MNNKRAFVMFLVHDGHVCQYKKLLILHKNAFFIKIIQRLNFHI